MGSINETSEDSLDLEINLFDVSKYKKYLLKVMLFLVLGTFN